jgi:hypothetical protein
MAWSQSLTVQEAEPTLVQVAWKNGPEMVTRACGWLEREAKDVYALRETQPVRHMRDFSWPEMRGASTGN